MLNNRKIYLFLLILFIFSCKSSQLNYIIEPNSIYEFFKHDAQKQAIVSVHRGGGELKGYPENCIESFQSYANIIPAIIECDIEMTKDSVMVLMHDKTLDRTSTGTGTVFSKNYSDIKDLKLKDNFNTVTQYKIPSLEETLKWGKNKVVFTLDVKKTTPYLSVINMVNKMKAQNYAAIITYNFNEVIQVSNYDKNILISASIMQIEDYNRIHEAGVPDKNLVAFIGTREPKKELIDFLHSKGISCILGVLGNLDKKAAANDNKPYAEYLKLGVDIFATDRPEAVYSQILKSKNLK